MKIEMETKEKIVNKLETKKLLKEKNLFESAYDLFITKGVYETSIDDIVKQAGVAKGTFYRYFKDKYDIIDKIILKKSSIVIEEAINYSKQKNSSDFIETVIFFTEYIIDYLKENKRMLRIIHKNLSWGVYRKALANAEEYIEMQKVKQFLSKAIINDFDIFMIIELTGTVCYSSIILEEPAPIEEMKPELFKMIKKMLSI